MDNLATQQQLAEYSNSYDRSLHFDPYANNNPKLMPSSNWGEYVYPSESLSNDSALAAASTTYPPAHSISSEDYAVISHNQQSAAPGVPPGNAYPGCYAADESDNGTRAEHETDPSGQYRQITAAGHPASAGIINGGFGGFGATVPPGMYLPNSSSVVNPSLYYSQHMPIRGHPQAPEYPHLPSFASNCVIPNEYNPFPQTNAANNFQMIDYHNEYLRVNGESAPTAPGHPGIAHDHYWTAVGNQISPTTSKFPPPFSAQLDQASKIDATENIQEITASYNGRSVFGFAMRNREDDEGLFTPRIQSTMSLDSSRSQFSVVLLNQNMWFDFYQNQTEMIITKTGRRMFPYLSIEVSGLDENKQYNVFVDVQQICNQILKYHSGRWVPNGEGELWPLTGSTRGRIYMHPDSPNSGRHWMKQEIHFMKLKLTNNKVISEEEDGKMIIVNSMHSYIPRINFVEVDSSTVNKFYAIATFPVTEFIVVTAYQNTEVTELKIKYNPFAKGFRESHRGASGSENVSNGLINNICHGSEPRDNKCHYYISHDQQTEANRLYIPRVQMIPVQSDVQPLDKLQEVGNQEYRQISQPQQDEPSAQILQHKMELRQKDEKQFEQQQENQHQQQPPYQPNITVTQQFVHQKQEQELQQQLQKQHDYHQILQQVHNQQQETVHPEQRLHMTEQQIFEASQQEQEIRVPVALPQRNRSFIHHHLSKKMRLNHSQVNEEKERLPENGKTSLSTVLGILNDDDDVSKSKNEGENGLLLKFSSVKNCGTLLNDDKLPEEHCK